MKKILALALISIMIISMTGCSGVYEGSKSGYVTITDIPGISFDVYASAVKSATAVSQINKNSDMSDGNSYLYKNGATDYILFNSKSLTIVVQKINSINLENSKDKISTLNNVTFLGTSVLSKEYEYDTSGKDDVYKLIAQVDAGVSLTLTTFGDYTGQVAYVSYNGNDYMMFVGVPQTNYKDLEKEVQEAIEHMVKSLKINKEDFENNKVYEEDVNTTEKAEDDTSEKEEVVVPEVPEVVIPEPPVEEPGVPEENIDADINIEIVPETPEETEPPTDEEIVIEEPDENIDVPVEVIPEEPQEEIPTEPVTQPPVEEPDEDIVVTEKGTENVINVTNQKELEGNVTTIYSLAKVGDDVLSSGIDIDGNFQTVLVSISSYYNEETALDIIKNGVKKDGLYKYFDAPDGCHYEAIEYSVSGSATDSVYVNFKIVGIDGQSLKYKGITYGSRTYDILSTSEYKKDGYTKRICYYPVPNGCKEYVLQFGESGNQIGYVKISN